MRTLLLLSIFLFPIAASAFTLTDASCAVWTRSLAVGAGGEDVRMMQRMLNLAPETRIAASGPGAPGEESNYFGPKTKTAVIKFQNLYKKEVLLPAGLTSGTGFVGQWSRIKLADLCHGVVLRNNNLQNLPPPAPTSANLPPPAPPPVSPTSPSSIQDAMANNMYIMYPSQYTAPRGATISISGVGLPETGNNVHIGGYVMTGVPATRTGTINLTIPSGAPRGRNILWVSNAKGATNASFLIVTDPAVPGPVVSSFTPKEGWVGTKVTVTGSGFLPTGNLVYVGSDILNVPSPDGTTLEFNVSPVIPGVAPGQDVPGYDARAPFWFYILNDNGMSQASEFTIKA